MEGFPYPKGTSFTDTKASDSAYNYYWVFPYYLDANDFMRSARAESTAILA